MKKPKPLGKTVADSPGLTRLIQSRERNRVLHALQSEATDAEAARIEDLAVATGLWWRCACGWVNDCTDARCGGLGRAGHADCDGVAP